MDELGGHVIVMVFGDGQRTLDLDDEQTFLDWEKGHEDECWLAVSQRWAEQCEMRMSASYFAMSMEWMRNWDFWGE